ncbi:MAG: substrate-binding domain-containing protein [Deltaproteobacteria bacterium]|nr:substrate-binding domain-containing protein [Deltaproteobacteria bacterium]
MIKKSVFILVVEILVLFSCLHNAVGGEKAIIRMSTTTSTENSGLLDALLPEFTKDTGIQVKVFAKGTGAAIRDGMDGNVDIIFVHDRAREDKFIEEGYGAYRLAVMHNDFVVVGPKNDPAGIKGANVAEAFKRIANSNALFISRGDDSGTHSKEKEIWGIAGITLAKKNIDADYGGKTPDIGYEYPAVLAERYVSIGQGMGKALTFAEEKQAYTLADRGTYLEYKYGRAQGLDLEILCEGDDNLGNPYGIIPVNPEKYPDIRFEDADRLAKWLVSEKGQKLIADYKIHGRQAFFPDAKK